MIYFKRCPRCNGDLHKAQDIYGSYVACLQCGYYLTDAEEVVLLYPRSHWYEGLSTGGVSLLDAVHAVKGVS